MTAGGNNQNRNSPNGQSGYRPRCGILVVVVTIIALPKMFYRFKVMAAPKNQQRRTASTSRFEMKKIEPFLSINFFYSFNKANLF
jgi:hypothetical protein